MRPSKNEPKPRRGWVIVYGNHMHPILWKSRKQAHTFAATDTDCTIRRATLTLDPLPRRKK